MEPRGLGESIGRRPVERRPAGVEESAGAPAVLSDSFARAVVYGVWLVLALGLAAYVVKYGRNLPFWDDWELVPVLTGREPFTLSWLWALNNEHRTPVARFLIFAVFRTVGDLRVVMLITNAMLAGVGLLLVRAARDIRGHQRLWDAALPLALMTFGHYENLIFSIQFFFVTPSLVALTLLSIGVRETWADRTGYVVTAAVLVAVLPLFGAIGLAVAVPLGGWLALVAAGKVLEETRSARIHATILSAGCLATAVLVVLYLVGFQRPAPTGGTPDAFARIRTAAEVLSIGFGPAGRLAWPYSSAAVLAAVVAAAALLVAKASGRGALARPQAAVAVVGCTFFGLCAVVGYGRAAFGEGQGFSDRYAIFSAPLIVCCYFAFELCASRNVSRALEACLFVLFVIAYPYNTYEGILYGRDRARRVDALVADVNRGIPPETLGQRHAGRLYPDGPVLGRRLAMLEADRSCVFKNAIAAPDCGHTVPVEPRLLFAHGMTWTGPKAECTADDPYSLFQLPRPMHVCELRLTFRLTKPTSGPAVFEAFWMLSGKNDYAPGERNETDAVQPSPDPQTVSLWVDDTVDQFRIDPDVTGCTFQLLKIEVTSREP